MNVKKMNVAVGSLVLIGMLLVMGGVVMKYAGLNLLEPYLNVPTNFFVVANTCFLIALIVDKFDKPE